MEQNKDGKTCCGSLSWYNVVWWCKLVVAVIAVPMVGIVVGVMVPGGDFGKLLAFMVTCWACVFLGMKLMVDNKPPSH